MRRLSVEGVAHAGVVKTVAANDNQGCLRAQACGSAPLWHEEIRAVLVSQSLAGFIGSARGLQPRARGGAE